MSAPKILVVEDSPTQSLYTEMLLRSQDYETRVVQDGGQAVAEAIA